VYDLYNNNYFPVHHFETKMIRLSKLSDYHNITPATVLDRFSASSFAHSSSQAIKCVSQHSYLKISALHIM